MPNRSGYDANLGLSDALIAQLALSDQIALDLMSGGPSVPAIDAPEVAPRGPSPSFLSSDGQERRQALDNGAANLADRLNWLLGPAAKPLNTAMVGMNHLSDASDFTYAAEASRNMWNDPSIGNAAQLAASVGAVALPLASYKMIDNGVDVVGEAWRSLKGDVGDFVRNQEGSVPIPGKVDAPFDMSGGMGHNGGPAPTLIDALDARHAEMQLAPVKRTQPDVGGAGVLDRDYMTPAPSGTLDDLSKNYPRNPNPTAPLPKKDRARVLVDRREEIATRLAERIKATGQMDEPTRYFYHSDGPIYRGAIEAGLSPDEASKYLKDLGNQVAATSPRTKVEENLRNATLSMAKEAQGIGVRDIIGKGTVDPKTGVPGISEKGYPMMTGKGGIHGKLLDDLGASGSLDVNTNPKPSNFGPNVAGNRSSVTIDTHAIRGTLQTLNEIEPGSVPEAFIYPKHRAAYKKDPSKLTPDMIDDTMASQMVGPKGGATSMMTEYAVFADIWHDAAEKLGVSPAEAQSMGWFGFGDETNLGSARKTPVDIFDERISVTAKALGVSPKQASRGVFRREIPLLGVGGAAAGIAGSQPAEAFQPRDPEEAAEFEMHLQIEREKLGL